MGRTCGLQLLLPLSFCSNATVDGRMGSRSLRPPRLASYSTRTAFSTTTVCSATSAVASHIAGFTRSRTGVASCKGATIHWTATAPPPATYSTGKVVRRPAAVWKSVSLEGCFPSTTNLALRETRNLLGTERQSSLGFQSASLSPIRAPRKTQVRWAGPSRCDSSILVTILPTVRQGPLLNRPPRRRNNTQYTTAFVHGGLLLGGCQGSGFSRHVTS